jgi:uncharacterized protein YdeI (YjbR/CyaY-like superfamily)
MKNAQEYCPQSQRAWRNWLQANHEKKEAVWLVYFKKRSPQHNLSWSEAVDEALCFGWIDSTARPIDDEKYKQYFSKRKSKSNWSKINKDKVKVLIEQGRMEAAGLKSIEVAKENGSWTFLDQIEALIIPADLNDALANDPSAMNYFDGLGKSDKKILLHWVISAKRPATRQKRISEIAESAKKQSKPKPFL